MSMDRSNPPEASHVHHVAGTRRFSNRTSHHLNLVDTQPSQASRPRRLRWIKPATLAAGLLALLIPTSVALALFTNGGFEAGDFSSWTQTNFLNFGLVGSPPFTEASIVRTAGGSNQSIVVGPNTPLSQPDSVLGASASLRWPRFGSFAARVNGPTTGRISNTLLQTDVITSSDVDTVDGKVHLRFAFAPVLEDPGHDPEDQPFFYINLKNVTKGNAVLYETFNYANQAGIPWQTIVVGGRTFRYVDWIVVDIAPGNIALEVGDTVTLEVIAADCSLSGHAGWVYVDAFGSLIPGLTVVKTAPAQVNANTDLTYNFTYRNSGATTIANVQVTEAIPANTTFVSVSDTVNCSESSGTVTCNFGTLDPDDSGTFTVTVHVDPGATGTISNGDYDISGTAYPALLGPLVTTDITAALLADLSITKSDAFTQVSQGQTVTYTIVAENNGPNAVIGASVSDSFPSELSGVSWTCATSGGASCTASGTGNISDTIDLPVGSIATYTVTGVVAIGSSGNLSNIASIGPPGGITDSDSTNDGDIDTDTILDNQIPTVSDFSKSAAAGAIVTFTSGDFTTRFNDPDSDPLDSIRVISLPANGTLYLNGVPVSVNDVIAAANLALLTFTGDPGWTGSTSFQWNGSDGTMFADDPAVVTINITDVTGAGLPATGFAPGRQTALPGQPITDAYTDLGTLWLEIPSLQLKETIVGVPQTGRSWDVTWLGERIGYLEGTAFPSLSGNSALTGHVYLSDGLPGPFYGLHRLTWGDQVILHAWGLAFTYEVRESASVSSYDLSPLRHENGSWVTLLTCSGYDSRTGKYSQRLATRAALIDVSSDR